MDTLFSFLGNFFGFAAFILFWLSIICFFIGLIGIGILGIIISLTCYYFSVRSDDASLNTLSKRYRDKD